LFTRLLRCGKIIGKNMELIKELTKDNFLLKHSRYTDHFGFKRDSFEFVKITSGGKVIYPLIGKLKVSTLALDSSVGEFGVNNYTEEEYEDILSQSIEKYGRN